MLSTCCRPIIHLLARAVLFVLVLSSIASAKNPGKLAPEFAQLPPGVLIDAVVQFNNGASARADAKVRLTGGLLKALLGDGAGLYVLQRGLLEHLSDDPDVKYISPNRKVNVSLEYANPTVGAYLARSAGIRGKGIAVAVLDSGISNHPDLRTGQSRVIHERSFVPGDRSPRDDYGHGTHVAGIIAGDASLSEGDEAKQTFRGMGEEINLVNLRVLNDNGQGTDAAVIEAIDYAISVKSRYNIRVLNISLGRPVFESWTKAHCARQCSGRGRQAS